MQQSDNKNKNTERGEKTCFCVKQLAPQHYGGCCSGEKSSRRAAGASPHQKHKEPLAHTKPKQTPTTTPTPPETLSTPFSSLPVLLFLSVYLSILFNPSTPSIFMSSCLFQAPFSFSLPSLFIFLLGSLPISITPRPPPKSLGWPRLLAALQVCVCV